MVFSILDTPRTEAGDRTRLSAAGDLDFTNDDSISSPTKGSNDLLRQIHGMRNDMQTPRARLPLGDRRNLAFKNEFTPLLKSAAKNRLARGMGKENSQLETPLGLKAGYGQDSPALPFNSSVMIEEHTGSSLGESKDQATPVHVVSSSPASTPMAILPNRGEGPLDHGRNLATLREQEARLEQIDKENFSLKLKIHFMEEALRKNGKDYNEAAIRENTELKVDKVTLQRDLKQYRKSLAQAEKDLEDYKKQLMDYADKVKRRHMSEGMQEEMTRLQKLVEEKDAAMSGYEQKLRTVENGQVELDELRDEIGDLEAELREKESLIDAKDEELQGLREQSSNGNASEKDMEEKDRLLDEREDELQNLQDEFDSLKTEYKRKLGEYERLVKEKDEQLADLEEQLKEASSEYKANLDKRDGTLQEKDRRIKELLDIQHEAESQAQSVQCDHQAEIRLKDQSVQEKVNDVQSLRRKLEAADGRNDDVEKLNDEIRALQNKLIEKGRLLEDKDAEIHTLKQQSQADEELEDELMRAEDRVRELEAEQQRNLKELQSLRDLQKDSTNGRQQALETAQGTIKDLEHQQHLSREHELQLERDINKLKSDMKTTQNKLDEANTKQSAQSEQWESQRRSLESSKTKAESKATSLETTIAELREAEGDISGREARLQRNLDSEKARHESEEDSLRKEIEELIDESEQQCKVLETTKAQLVKVQREYESSQTQVVDLQDKIQGLEDEIEVLQLSQDEDIDRAKDELEASKQEAEGLKRQLKGVQQDLANTQSVVEEVLEKQKSTAKASSPRTTPSPQRDLQKKIRELNASVEQLRKEREELLSKIVKLETSHADTKADYDTLHFDLEASNGTRAQLQQKLQDVQAQLIKSNKEKGALQVSLTSANADLHSTQASLSELEAARDVALKATRDLRTQLQTTHREAERKFQTQAAEYERDIDNLEQDLEEAQLQKTNAIQAQTTSTSTITRLKNKITSLEADLAAYRAGRTTREASVEERKDLHDMLKDTKLEAEDLALQIRERDARIQSASSKESELRVQLARVRNERAAQSARADSTAERLTRLQSSHDALVSEVADLQAAQRSVRFPKSSLTASFTSTSPADATTRDTTAAALAAAEKQAKRHAAELRGLALQIEYLGARLRREESFRADLGFVKRYFSQQVAMHARCTGADLALVDAMGIRTRDVVLRLSRQQGAQSGAEGTGKKRPTLKALGLMVLAGVRIKRAADVWVERRRGHEGLLKKLEAVRRERKVGKEGKELVKGGRRRGAVF